MKKILRYSIKGDVLEIELTKLNEGSPWMGTLTSGMLDIIKRKSLYGQAHKRILNIKYSIKVIIEKGKAGIYYYNRNKEDYVLLWELNVKDYSIKNEEDSYIPKNPMEKDMIDSGIITRCGNEIIGMSPELMKELEGSKK